jgi:hypothetical protein
VAEFEANRPYMEAFGKEHRKDHASTKALVEKTKLTLTDKVD